MGKLEGRAALVTGASRGIGRAIAVRLAREGADVAITVHHEPGDATLAAIRASGVRAVPIEADLADVDAPARAVARAHAALGRLDILVNNAGGGGPTRPLLELSAPDWDAVMALNGPYAEISPEELAERLRTGTGPTLLDVREPWEHELCAIAGSRLCPMEELPCRVDEVERDREVIVYCHHGIRSAAVVQWLRGQGILAVNLAGGIDAFALRVDATLRRY